MADTEKQGNEIVAVVGSAGSVSGAEGARLFRLIWTTVGDVRLNPELMYSNAAQSSYIEDQVIYINDYRISMYSNSS